MTLLKYNSDYDTLVPNSFSGLLDKFFDQSLSASRMNKFIPSVDLAETEKEYEIHLSVPGMQKEDFNVDVNNGRIVISGERKFEKEDKKKNFHSIETQFGSFTRTFSVPENVDAAKIEASYKDGILLLTLPKTEKNNKANTIKVK